MALSNSPCRVPGWPSFPSHLRSILVEEGQMGARVSEKKMYEDGLEGERQKERL